jgi:Xaa-Pro dipeptidase
VIPDDFWYEQAIASEPVWGECFKVVRVNSLSEVAKALPVGQFAYLGESSSLAGAMNIAEANCNPKPLCSYLDYYRAYKTEYELDQLRTANQLALNGHQAARNCFLAGGSEYDIHLAYLGTCGVLEDETPYTNIVALDDKSAILHYQNKRRQLAQTSQVLLIDAGYRVRGYGSDITRTWVRDGVHAKLCRTAGWHGGDQGQPGGPGQARDFIHRHSPAGAFADHRAVAEPGDLSWRSARPTGA